MSKIKPNIVRGGQSIDLGNNMFLMQGRPHSRGGIDIGKNLEVEGGEVMQYKPNEVRVFSKEPILNGVSPAQYVLGGANPNDVFNAQEYWKRVNRVSDDGTTKAKFGTKSNNDDERKLIGYGNNFDSRLRYLDLDQKLVAYINKIAKDYNISPALLTNRLFHEGAIDNAIRNYDNSVKKGVKVNSLLDSNHIDNDSYNLYGLDDSYTLLKNGKLKLNRNIPVTNEFHKNEKGRVVNYAGTSDPYDAIELLASNISYIKNEMQNKFPNIKGKDLDTITNKAFNIGLYGAIDDVKNNGVGSKYIIDDRLYNYNYNNDFYLNNNNRNDIINTFTIESQNNLFNDYKDIYKNNFIEKYGEEFNNSTNSPNFLKNKITKKGDSAEEYSNYKADETFKNTYFYPLGTDYSYNNPFFKIKTEFKYGGIHIKPSKRGTFTAAASKHGMGVQAFASKVLANKDDYSPAMVKKANFAKNASKWNHKEFGGNMDFNYIIGKNNIYKLGGRKKAPLGIDVLNSQNLHRNAEVFDGVPAIVIDEQVVRPDVNVEQQRLLNEASQIINNSIQASVGRDNATLNRINQIEGINGPITIDGRRGTIGPNGTINLENRYTLAGDNRGIGYKSTRQQNRLLAKAKVKNAVDNIKQGIKDNSSELLSTGINLAGNLAGSLINLNAINKMKYYDIIPLRANKLKTNININPQLDTLREQLARFENDTRNNTSSSKTALARRQSARARTAQAINQLFGTKENLQTELINRDRLNQQQVGNMNVQMRNRWRAGKSQFDNQIRNMRAENAIAGINNAIAAFNGENGYFNTRDKKFNEQANRALYALTAPNAVDAITSKNAEKLINTFVEPRFRKRMRRSLGIED